MYPEDPDFAACHDTLPFWSAPFGMLLLRHLPLKRNAVVLDIGCGTGFPLIPLAGQLGPGARLYGIDCWREAVKRARRKCAAAGLSQVEVFVGDAKSVDLAPSSVDLVVSNLGLNHFDDPMAVLRECHRILKRGGTIAMTTNPAGHMRELYRRFREVLIAADRGDLICRLEKHEASRRSPAAIAALLTSAGFSHVRTITDEFVMRFADGTALFHDPYVAFGFLPGWHAIVDATDRDRLFRLLEEDLNSVAADRGCLELTVPMAYIEGLK